MSGRNDGSPGWVAKVRHWLWLDHPQRTDASEAGRGFYPGGPPIYTNRKPAGLRFLLAVTVIGIAIALLIIVARDSDAQTPGWQDAVPADPPVVVTVPATEHG